MKKANRRYAYSFKTRKMETLFLQACRHFKVSPQDALDSLISFVLRDTKRMEAWRSFLTLYYQIPDINAPEAFPWLPVALDPDIQKRLFQEAERRGVTAKTCVNWIIRTFLGISDLPDGSPEELFDWARNFSTILKKEA